MIKAFRIITVLSIAAISGACVSPYQAQMGALDNAFRNGQISEEDYNRELTRLQIGDAGYQQQAANTATAVAVGAAAVGAAAIIANSYDHRHHHYRGRYYRPSRYYRPYRRW